MDGIIYAKASGAGTAAISVIRLSGPGTHDLVGKLLRGKRPEARLASLRRLFDPVDGSLIDQALVLLFGAGASSTGEEYGELHLHGGEAVSLAVFGALEALGARLARPGEFSRRAVRIGALDLAQAESIGALIAAETEIERRQALRGLEGEIGVLADSWRDALISIIGLLETGVDFVEEELGDDLIREASSRLQTLRQQLVEHIEESARVDVRRDRPVVVLIGPPNAGKSSLLNAIAGVERAIVSATPGTTRDSVDLSLRIAGQEILLTDTAGLRDAADEIERQGVERSRAAMERADRRIFVVSADTRAEFAALAAEIRDQDAVFWTKSDLSPPQAGDLEPFGATHRYAVSAKEPQTARRAIERFLQAGQGLAETPNSPLIGSQRRVALVSSAEASLGEAADRLETGSSELAIEELRRAADQLEAMTGRIDQEDVLDALFSRFCIGK